MIAEVIVEIASSETDRIYDYILPEELSNPLGRRVMVPFGKRKLEGYIVGLKDESRLEEDKLKEILYPLEEFPVILPEMISLMEFMSAKFHLRKVDCLRLFIPSEMRKDKVKSVINVTYTLSSDFENKIKTLRKNAFMQLKVVEILKEKGSLLSSELAEQVGYGPLKKLKELGVILENKSVKLRAPAYATVQNQPKILTDEQKRAVSGINSEGTYVLFGVTGSGKTEVYMGLIEKCLQAKKNAIMLVPEISLTPQVFSAFKSRFGDYVAILHSGLSAGERFDEWKRLLLGQAKIAVGARSAIFAPLSNLGLIIIDEEHEQTYYSENNPRYYTHDVAMFRSKIACCPLVLGSATPSINTFSKTVSGEYKLFELPKRVNKKEMPPVKIVDMLSEIRNGNSGLFSLELLALLENVVRQKKQAMIFINRRGFSSFMMCRRCGYVAKCEDCDVSLVYHRAEEKLKCHFCGRRYKALTVCPICKSDEIRQGAVGTQKVANELANLFPDAKIFRMDNDTTQTKDSHLKILSAFKDAKPAFLVGTQMIAKGHDFSDVILVGIIDADQSLYQTDYKSAEKTFQLITQVSGRAGRSESEGKVVLQTYVPKHYVYRYAANYDYKGFFEKESNLRKITKFPPYSEIIRILITGEKESDVSDAAKKAYTGISQLASINRDSFIYLGAMKSPVKKIKNRYRYQILMRLDYKTIENIKPLIYNICDEVQNVKISLFVELNPQNLS